MTYALPPDDVELGLEPDRVDAPMITLRCGCAVYADDLTHDADDCCEAQADALAEIARCRR